MPTDHCTEKCRISKDYCKFDSRNKNKRKRWIFWYVWIVYFTSFLTTFSQNYTSCCKSRSTLEYIHSWIKCSGLCITFSQCQSPDWGPGQTLSNDCQLKMFISFSRVYNFDITFWKIRNAFFKTFVWLWGEAKKYWRLNGMVIFLTG